MTGKKRTLKPHTLPQEKQRYFSLLELGARTAIILWYGYFAYIFGLSLYETFKINVLIFLIYELLIIGFTALRTSPKEISTAPYDWFIGIAGTLSPTLLRPVDTSLLPQGDLFLIMQTTGLLISAIGIISLAQSIGIVAANRGIKTSGIFRFIRIEHTAIY